MPSRKSDARRSDVSVARFVLAGDDAAAAPPAEPATAIPSEPPAARASSPVPPPSVSHASPQERKDKDKEREREKEREKERDAITIEVCPLVGRIAMLESRMLIYVGGTGPHTPQIHHHPSSQGRLAAQHANTGQCDPGAEQERNSLYQPSCLKVFPPLLV